jgi:hypothetical protein
VNRQRVLLGILAVMLLITGWVYLMPDSSPPPAVRAGGAVDADAGVAEGARPAPRAAANEGSASGNAVRAVLPLHIENLNRPSHGFTTGRDPWRFYQPPPPPPPPPHRLSDAELRALREAEEARQRLLAQQQAEAVRVAAIPKPAPFTWTYLGNFGPAEQRIAVFSDGQKVINAREGEILESKFIVARIGYESVDIRFVGFPDWPAERLAAKH